MKTEVSDEQQRRLLVGVNCQCVNRVIQLLSEWDEEHNELMRGGVTAQFDIAT